eukprot:TRINITY_DN1504_c0_g1_i2.p1 TRINITY_DN1504_c0_g1~~TRINITY_DN1504_c0_g1_i2.p1  ORF type:complete len:258 (-),score=18.93 TRINITY_DN1504_c0_g1_i2:220-993(-)
MHQFQHEQWTKTRFLQQGSEYRPSSCITCYDAHACAWFPLGPGAIGCYDPHSRSLRETITLPDRYIIELAIHKDVLYIIGYEPRKRPLYAIRLQDPTRKFAQVGTLCCGRIGSTVVTHKGLVYIAGGSRGDKIPHDTIECFDPRTHKSTFVTMGPPLAFAGSCALGDCLYFGGGDFGDSNPISAFHRYHPATEQWTQLASMKHRRSRCALCAVDGNIYVMGGWGRADQWIHEVERYDVARNEWTVINARLGVETTEE